MSEVWVPAAVTFRCLVATAGRVFYGLGMGCREPILLEPEVREMMKRMGEYDNLKRVECMAFGKDVLSRV